MEEHISPDYYDLDDILAEQERVTCQVRLRLRSSDLHLIGLGEPVDRKTKQFEIPFWLAQGLESKMVVTTNVPRAFGPRAGAALKADPVGADLRTVEGGGSGQYFRLGQKIATLCVLHVTLLPFCHVARSRAPDAIRLLLSRKQDYALGEMLHEAYTSRLSHVLHTAHRAMARDVSTDLERLDACEREVFRLAYWAASMSSHWRKSAGVSGLNRLTASTLSREVGGAAAAAAKRNLPGDSSFRAADTRDPAGDASGAASLTGYETAASLALAVTSTTQKKARFG
ncbi:hypothetical protein H696_02589 [Fonticula alba]|uniref:DNA replication complex GINS protein PSF3 N-terminal domain-containing protein n=1 Tax=Fonticula alba TaxID=691883 RepID=A0A058Z7I0_FONAL|nr:hypothetical protein H696_02589 [Fonticula alba]KCV70259.1 hypothetical protein H696_02589 [Fonticula alba]|eukprot:XP_009494775.1 hypothetical protein H696_02589 [Fonticula alba]